MTYSGFLLDPAGHPAWRFSLRTVAGRCPWSPRAGGPIWCRCRSL